MALKVWRTLHITLPLLCAVSTVAVVGDKVCCFVGGKAHRCACRSCTRLDPHTEHVRGEKRDRRSELNFALLQSVTSAVTRRPRQTHVIVYVLVLADEQQAAQPQRLLCRPYTRLLTRGLHASQSVRQRRIAVVKLDWLRVRCFKVGASAKHPAAARTLEAFSSVHRRH